MQMCAAPVSLPVARPQGPLPSGGHHSARGRRAGPRWPFAGFRHRRLRDRLRRGARGGHVQRVSDSSFPSPWPPYPFSFSFWLLILLGRPFHRGGAARAWSRGVGVARRRRERRARERSLRSQGAGLADLHALRSVMRLCFVRALFVLLCADSLHEHAARLFCVCPPPSL